MTDSNTPAARAEAVLARMLTGNPAEYKGGPVSDRWAADMLEALTAAGLRIEAEPEDKCQACGGPLFHKAVGTAAICHHCLSKREPIANPQDSPQQQEIADVPTEFVADAIGEARRSTDGKRLSDLLDSITILNAVLAITEANPWRIVPAAALRLPRQSEAGWVADLLMLARSMDDEDSPNAARICRSAAAALQVAEREHDEQCFALGKEIQHLRDEAEAAEADKQRMEKALEPFAAIALARDADPSAPDMIDAPDLAITPADVRRARAALSPTANDEARKDAKAHALCDDQKRRFEVEAQQKGGKQE